MAKYYWYPYKKSYKKYGKYWKKGWKRSVVKSSKSGTKRVTVVIPVEADYQFSFEADSKYSAVIPMTACRNVNDSATMTRTATFKAYAALYDEARIVGCKFKWYFGGGFTNSTGFFTFATAVDRCTMPEDLTTRPTAQDILASSSVIKTVFTVQQRLGAVRQYWASTLMEKNTWWDTTLDSNGWYPPALWDSTTAFKPTVHFCAIAAASSSSSQQLPYRVEAEWIVQFRNPKVVAANANRSVFSDMVLDKVEEVKEVDDEVKAGAKKFDSLTDEEKAKIMALVGSMDEES